MIETDASAGIIEKSSRQRGSRTAVSATRNGVGLDGGAITSGRSIDGQLYFGFGLHINSPCTWYFSIDPGCGQAGDARLRTGWNT